MPDRPAFDAIFYLLRTGSQWKALPRGEEASPDRRFPSGKAGPSLRMSPRLGQPSASGTWTWRLRPQTWRRRWLRLKQARCALRN